MVQINDTSWITERGRVAIFTHRSVNGDQVKFATVERLTDAQVILTDDRRFWLKDLREVGKSNRSSYGPWSELRPVDDPDVVRLHARQRVQYLARKITVEVNNLPAGASVAQVAGLLESIERRVAGVRADVAALNDEED